VGFFSALYLDAHLPQFDFTTSVRPTSGSNFFFVAASSRSVTLWSIIKEGRREDKQEVASDR
jgi:hypothetical protein